MQRSAESGAVTAEAALGLCLLVIVAMGLSWMVCLGVVAVQAHDAAREGARALARGESETVAVGLARQVAAKGSSIAAQPEGRLIRVIVRSPVRGPGGVFAFIGTVEISGQAVAAREDAEHGSP